MASREEEKRRRREERERREREEQAARHRRQRMMTFGGAGIFVVIVAIVAIVIATSGGGSSAGKSAQAGLTDASGLQVSAGPWAPEYPHLQQRVKALGLPDPSDAIYHVHSHLAMFVDGKRVQIPAQIGIDVNNQYLTSLHTHDTTGVIHQEAVQKYPFTLGQFISVWGVKFTPTQLGAYHAGRGLVLQTYVNGKLVPNGPAYRLRPHDNIVVGFGSPGSFPKSVPFKYPAGE
ncbi:MAG: hypothetical protein JOZ25_12840 [Actinobacteria bacterium]|nr:hypothetical protein [Actinomycetota bacterium]